MTYISIRQIMDDLLAHPMLQDLTLERAINYAVQFIQILGYPQEFIEKTEVLEVKDYRALLPCDFYEIIQVRLLVNGDNPGPMFIASTDSFHMSEMKTSRQLTYKIQNSVIYTSLENGKIEIAYNAMMLDKDGYPMIPENSAFIKALELYIKKAWFTVLFDMGKLPQGVLQNTQQEYAWAAGQASTSLIKPSLDEMQAISNSWNTLLVKPYKHDDGFESLGTRQYLTI